jgi:hypothetical protein
MKPGSLILIHGVLLFLLIGMCGSLWFLLPTRESLDQARRQPAEAPAPAAVRAPDPAAPWRARLATAQSELDAWKRQRDQASAELEKLTAAPEPLAPGEQDVSRLALALVNRQAELERLHSAAAELLPAAERTPAIASRSLTKGKEPVWLQLYHNRVLPVDEQYYSVRTIDSGGMPFRVLRRTAEGEIFPEAMAAGSKFQAALAKLSPEKQYVQCLVAPDSYDILRRVMQFAAGKQIGIVWDPYPDEDGRIVLLLRRQGGANLAR